MRSLRPIASLSLSTATSISFIKKGLRISLSCGRKNRLAALSVVMPRRMSTLPSTALMLSFSLSSSPACSSASVGGSYFHLKCMIFFLILHPAERSPPFLTRFLWRVKLRISYEKPTHRSLKLIPHLPFPPFPYSIYKLSQCQAFSVEDECRTMECKI